VEAFQRLVERHVDESRAQLLKKYADTNFPKGPGSEALLFEPDANDFQPRLITQRADGTWTADRLPFHDTDLHGDRSVGYADAPGARLVSLVRRARRAAPSWICAIASMTFVSAVFPLTGR
jgi:hypothetical protein